MSYFAVREIVLVLAIVVVCMNWGIDHYSQVARQDEQLKEFVDAQKTHDEILRALRFGVTGDDARNRLTTP